MEDLCMTWESSTNIAKKNKLMKPLFEGNFSLLTKSCTQTILFFCRFLSLCRFLCKAMLTKFCEPQSHRLIAMPASNSWESRIQSSQILTRNSRVSKSNTRSLGRCLLLCLLFRGETCRYNIFLHISAVLQDLLHLRTWPSIQKEQIDAIETRSKADRRLRCPFAWALRRGLLGQRVEQAKNMQKRRVYKLSPGIGGCRQWQASLSIDFFPFRFRSPVGSCRVLS